MKNKFLTVALLAAILTHGALTISSCSTRKESKTEEYENEDERGREKEGEEEEDEKEETGADKQLSSWFWAKGYPDASNLTKKYQDAWQEFLQLKKNNPLGGNALSRVQGMGNWTFLGPKILGGRILSLAISPVAHLDGNRTIFAGSASGGIWKTYVSGIGAGAWQKVVTNTNVLGVQNIVYHPTDTNIIIAGTGEVYRVENYTSGAYSSNQVSNIGRNAWKARGTYGIGILRSTDAGNTWTQTLIKTETDLFGIQKIKFLPGDPTVVFACATDGLYKSTNTGASWTKIWTGNYCSDIVINAANTNQIVIAAGNVTNSPKGIWRSTNGGTSFTQITGTGFPNFNQYRGFTALTMLGSSSTPDTIVASVGAGDVNVDGTYNEVEIYRSGDFGSTWASVSNSHHSKYQSWFSHGATMYPGNVAGSPRKVFIYGTASAVLTMSGTPATTGAAVTVGSNGGATFNSYFTDGQQEGTTSYLHSDVHDVQFWPGSSSIAYWATDGGVFRTANANVSPSSSMTFATCNGGLYAQQFYPSIAQSQASANILIGGLQDNQTVRYNGTGWARIIGGDGGPAMFKPDDETKVLGSSDTRGVYRSTNTGTSFPTSVLAYLGNVPFGSDDRTSFASPIAVCPSNTNRWYVGSDNIHVSTDAGVTFNNDVSNVPGTNYIEALHKPAIAIGVSSTNASKLYVSVSPFSQNISTDALFYNPPANLRKSTDGGTSFTTVTGSLPDRIITDIFVSPTNDDSVFVTLGGFGTTHIYVTGNGGTTWTPRGSGLPDLPFNTILIDPNNPQILYTGCDYGIYVSQDRGANWYDFNNGFWDATYVVDLALTPGNKIRAATHGKGIFEATRWDGIVILPVHFSSFTGVNQGGNNDLKWIVDQESNLSHYEIERSIDGFNYQVIKQVAARNSVLQTTYTATDFIGNNPSPNYYYRIKSFNQDGTYMYSEIVVIKISNKAKFEVLGNPFSNSLTIRYNVPQTEKLQLNLLDLQGRFFRREELIASVGTGTYTIADLSAVPAGMYLLNFDMNNTRTTIKVLKQ